MVTAARNGMSEQRKDDGIVFGALLVSLFSPLDALEARSRVPSSAGSCQVCLQPHEGPAAALRAEKGHSLLVPPAAYAAVQGS